MSQPEKPPRTDEERRAARRERDRRYRARMRAQGYRRVVRWEPTGRVAVLTEWQRQIRALAADPAEHEFAEAWAREQDTAGWVGDAES